VEEKVAEIHGRARKSGIKERKCREIEKRERRYAGMMTKDNRPVGQ
jgi:hypothetical protein